jgi:hypothetical protein
VFLSHLPEDIHPANMYEDYFKFAFVRNPWDRLVSFWRNKIIGNINSDFGYEKEEFEYFVNFVGENINLSYGNKHLRLQSRLIDMNNIDYLGRFENFNNDLEEVMKGLNIKAQINKLNASKRKIDYRDYYSDSSKDKVAKLYKRDINLFNYEF